MSAGQVIDGSCESWYGGPVTRKLQLNRSEVVEGTPVEPMGNVEPLAGVVVTVPHVPPVVGAAKVTCALVCPCAASAVMFSGQLKVHGGGLGLLAFAVTSELLLEGAES